MPLPGWRLILTQILWRLNRPLTWPIAWTVLFKKCDEIDALDACGRLSKLNDVREVRELQAKRFFPDARVKPDVIIFCCIGVGGG